jgi:hypothetical protein
MIIAWETFYHSEAHYSVIVSSFIIFLQQMMLIMF